jgi:hypothetical protein
MVKELKANGYCDHCCDVILKYAANNLWKDWYYGNFQRIQPYWSW